VSKRSKITEAFAGLHAADLTGIVPEIGTPCPRDGYVISGLDASGRMAMYTFRERKRDASALAQKIAATDECPCAVVEHITFPEDFRPNGADIVPVAYALAQHSGTPVEMWCHAD